MDIELLKQKGVTVEHTEHLSFVQHNVHNPLSIQVRLKRGDRTFEGKVYLMPNDPSAHHVLKEEDYLRLVVQRYTMNVAEYTLLEDPHQDMFAWQKLSEQQRRSQFNKYSSKWREHMVKLCIRFCDQLDAFLVDS